MTSTFKIALLASILAGLSNAISINKMESHERPPLVEIDLGKERPDSIRNLAQVSSGLQTATQTDTETGTTTHGCDYITNRLWNGSVDYHNILSKGSDYKYTDPGFPTDDALYFDDARAYYGQLST